MTVPVRARRILAVLIMLAAARGAVAQPPPPPPQPLPPVPVPPENPITESKRVLGKILFWEEQLSSDNTVACGTCHKPARAASDARIARNPGIDHLINTPDDILGSPGVIHSNAADNFEPHAVFALNRQITGRSAKPAIMAMYGGDLFWDGRARSTFTNPETGSVSIVNGGGLESQAVGPIVNSTEMTHDARTWSQVTSKLSSIRPLILATNLPADVATALSGNATYPQLFQAAFGSAAITAERIAFAIATYERTLLPNQTPWDRFIAGDTNALTQGQQQGWNTLRASPCVVCHAPPMFTTNNFENIGLRPVAEDNGRQAVTGLQVDRGKFRVPTLRNVGLKPTFMHNGQFNNLNQVLGFYANPGQGFPDNRSPVLPVALPPQTVPAVIDLIANGLTDPRVAAEQAPFDRPLLHSDLPPNPSLMGGALAGTGGFVPGMIAVSPPNLGNNDFKIGVSNALGGAQAVVLRSSLPPVGGQLANATQFGPITLSGVGANNGYGTWHWPLDELAIGSCDVYLQWLITDPGAAGGFARSPVAHLQMIPYVCTGDMNCDGLKDGQDVAGFVEAVLNPAAYSANHPGCNIVRADMNGDGLVNVADAAGFAQLLMTQ